MNLSFSAQTDVNSAQDFIDSKMSRRKFGVMGPEGMKKMCIFVDDLNMPKKEEYGAMPPLEIIRQWMDHCGW